MHQQHRNWFVLAMGMALACLGAGSLWAGNVYYVSPDGLPEGSGGEGTLLSPYDLETGVAKARGNYDEIRFLFGTYKLEKEIELVSSVRYLGWNGETDAPAGADRRRVVIDGQNAVRGFVSKNLRASMTIADLTVSNTTSTSESSAIFFQNTANSIVTNCVITGTHGAAVKGNGYNGGTLTYVDCDFTENRHNAWNILGSFSKGCIVRNCRFYNNHQTEATGAYGSLLTITEATVTDCVFTNNTGVGHSAIAETHSTHYTNCTFADNFCENDGGCFYLSDGLTSYFHDCTFRNNRSQFGGCFTTGTISGYSRGGVIWATNCTFTGNSVFQGKHPTTGAARYGYGGVQYFQSTGVDGKEDPTIGRTNLYFDCTFTANRADSQGGVFYSSSKWPLHGVRFESCTFNDNFSSNRAGVVDNGYKTGFCVLTNCSFTGNTALTAGGVFSGANGVPAASFRVDDCRFTNNVSKSGGVGYYANGAYRNCDFVGNVATNFVSGDQPHAGVFFLYGGSMWEPVCPIANVIENCTFVSNVCTRFGSPVIRQWADAGKDSSKNDYWWSNVTLRVSHCLFRGNRNLELYNFDQGASVLALRGLSGFDVTDCSFVENETFGHGCVVQVWPLTAGTVMTNGLVRNCLFFGNLGLGVYGGVTASSCYLAEPNTFVDSCSFVSNALPAGEGAGLYLGGDTPATGRVRNTLFYQNKSTNGTEPDIKTSADNLAQAFSNCFETRGILSGPDCIGKGLDPKFVDWEHGDCRLSFGSPCIDVGLNEPWMVGARDLQNNRKIPRIISGIVDIGCYEYRPDPGLLLFVK